jgi:6-phosphogluconolactonase
VVFDAAGTHLLVPCRDSDVVAQALFDPATGKITSNQPAAVAVPGGSGPRHLALSPDQRFAYLMNEFSGTVIAYRYDASAGTLSQPASIRSAPAGANENAGGHVDVHPNGRFVYTSNRNSNSLAMFSVDPASGQLSSIGHVRGGGLQFPRDFDLDPAGRFLVVGNEEAGTALVFRVDAASGLLTKIGGPVKAGQAPYGVRILPRSVLGMRP